jgi:predicted nucleic acid-binding protein
MKNSTSSSPPPRLFVDTWAWLVFSDDHDAAHAELVDLRRRYRDPRLPWVTTDYVLDELVTRLFPRRPFANAEAFCSGLFQAQTKGLLLVERITAGRFDRAWQLRLRYRDKPRISFTDLTSFVVMRELGIRHVLTADAHFTHAGFQRLP